MRSLLGFDIGTRRTGVAFLHSDTGVAVALPTLLHSSEAQLLSMIIDLCGERKVRQCVLGLPLLPSGEEGSQADLVQNFAQKLEDSGLTVSLLDERYTTPRSDVFIDGDSAAAVHILTTFFDRGMFDKS